MLDRLTLNNEKIVTMASSIKVIAGLADPFGAERVSSERPNGLRIRKMGVILRVF